MNQIFRFCKFEPFLLSRHYTSQGKNCTHYDILQVPQTASQKEIKDAFIKLSKKMHPDIKGNKTHEEFVKINEAYNVLSKEILRRDYDMNLKYGYSSDVFSQYPNPPQSSDEFRSRTGDFHYSRRSSKFRNVKEYEEYMESHSNDYYGIKGIKRLRNFWIGFICVTIATMSAIIQVILINKRILEEHDFHARRTLSYESMYNSVKRMVDSKTREQQIQDYMKNIEKSNNLKTDDKTN